MRFKDTRPTMAAVSASIVSDTVASRVDGAGMTVEAYRRTEVIELARAMPGRLG